MKPVKFTVALFIVNPDNENEFKLEGGPFLSELRWLDNHLAVPTQLTFSKINSTLNYLVPVISSRSR